MDVGELNRRRLYTGLGSDYRLRLWAPTSTSCAISMVEELLVTGWHVGIMVENYADRMSGPQRIMCLSTESVCPLRA